MAKSNAEGPTPKQAAEAASSAAISIVDLLGQTGSVLQKRRALADLDMADAAHREVRAWVVYACDPGRLLGVSAVPVRAPGGPDVGLLAKRMLAHGSWLTSRVLGLMRANHSKPHLSAALAYYWVRFLRNQARFREASFFKRIVRRALNIGVSQTICSQIWPGIIKSVEPMLAKSKPQVQCFPGLQSVKLNGCRVLSVKVDGGINFLTRRAKPLGGLQRLREQLELIPGDFVLDGEVCSSSLARAVSICRGGVNGVEIDSSDFVYSVFDYLTIPEWNHREGVEKAHHRYQSVQKTVAHLESLLPHGQVCFVEALPQHLVMNQEEAELHHEVLRSKWSHPFGLAWEGTIVKGIHPYLFACRAMWKIKDFKETDAEVLAVLEGKGRLVGTCGALKVRYHETGKVGKVGSGFTDEARNAIWSDPYSFIGKTAKIQFQDWQSQGRPQHPVFLQLREEQLIKSSDNA